MYHTLFYGTVVEQSDPNPVLQGQKFDPQGQYVARYCPELARLPKKYIHSPWLAPDDILAAANVRPGVDYPAPILDLKITRERALDSYKSLTLQ